MKNKYIKIISIAVVSLLVLVFLATFGFYYSVVGGVFGKLPSDEELLHIKNYQASEIYSADSVLIGRFFTENRSEVKIEDISPNLIHALIATEDIRFYEHEGVDQRSLMRVLIKSVLLGQNAGGGSTIGQQLAKNLFGRKSLGFLTMPVTKIKEGYLANKLNELYTKNEILELYFNTVSFGEDTYGIETATERFFSKRASEVSIQEAAVLIGMLKAPSTYNPRTHTERSTERRNVVLSQMMKYDYITKKEYEKAKGTKIELHYRRLGDNEGTAAYFKEHIRRQLEGWLKDQKNEKDEPYNLYTDGLKIYTTIHSKMQFYAEKAVERHTAKLTQQLQAELKRTRFFRTNKSVLAAEIKKTNHYKNLLAELNNEKSVLDSLKKKKLTSIWYKGAIVDTNISVIDSVINAISTLQAAFLVKNPENGAILAWVGGVSYQFSQFDHVTSKRQVGSVFKPVVYLKALQDGKRPCSFIPNQKITYTEYNDWTPSNGDGNYEGNYSVIGGLTNSVNTISVRLCMESGIKNVISLAHELGISDSLPKVPSLALGTASLPLYNLINVYSTIQNKGIYTSNELITSVYTQNRTKIYQWKPLQKEVIKEKYSQQMTAMLQSVVNNGTAQRLRSVYHLRGQIAGKTGTTQNHADGWFMGFTPHWVGGVWVGADNPSVRFKSIREGQGANMALPIWALFYSYVSKDRELTNYNNGTFKDIPEYDCELYKEDSGLRKFFKRKEKSSSKTGFKKKDRKKKFLGIF